MKYLFILTSLIFASCETIPVVISTDGKGNFVISGNVKKEMVDIQPEK